MKLSSINKLLKGIISIKDFKDEISKEIMVYENSLKVLGKSSIINLDEDMNLDINKKDFIFLCRAFLKKELNNFELNYILEGILLAEGVKFKNCEIEEACDILTDVELGLKLDNEFVEGVIMNIDKDQHLS